MDEALCAQSWPDAWFPGKGETAGRARAICDTCPVKAACRDYADSFEPNRPDDMFGMYGGESPAERYARRRAAREAAA
jgi:WhiB family redox-sensing transcriptional regulator